MLERLAAVILLLIILLGACSPDGGNGSGTTPGGSEEQESGRLAEEITLEDPAGDARAVVAVTCLQAEVANVGIELSGFTETAAGEIVAVDVAGQPTQVQIRADGTGTQISQSRLDGPATVAVALPDGGELEGEIQGC